MTWHLAIRSASALLAATALTACTMVDSAISTTENGAYRLLGVRSREAPPPVPVVDLNMVTWQKFAPDRRDLDAAEIAIIDKDAKTGATRVALKVEGGQALPAFWQAQEQTYTVVKGVFVAEGVDDQGQRRNVDQGPGTFVRVPALMVQHLIAKPGGQAVMIVTVAGDWKVNFLDATDSQQTAAN